MHKATLWRSWKAALAAPIIALAAPALAADQVLQVVDLSDKGFSTEGGEAKLFRLVNSRLGACKIEVVHYGETGRTALRFIFDRRLRFAARREYGYNGHIATTSNLKVTLRREINLASAEGAREFPAAYAESRGHFDASRLAQCNRTLRR